MSSRIDLHEKARQELTRKLDEHPKLVARVADLERTAACAEDMRDASDARVGELEAAAREIVRMTDSVYAPPMAPAHAMVPFDVFERLCALVVSSPSVSKNKGEIDGGVRPRGMGCEAASDRGDLPGGQLGREEARAGTGESGRGSRRPEQGVGCADELPRAPAGGAEPRSAESSGCASRRRSVHRKCGGKVDNGLHDNLGDGEQVMCLGQSGKIAEQWQRMFQQASGQLAAFADALGNTNGDPEVSLGMARELRTDLERVSVQADRVCRSWEEDATSLATENAVRELAVRARPEQQRSDYPLPDCHRCKLPAFPAKHDAPYRKLLDSEIEKLQKLCDDRSYLYWWDMGSVLLTLAEARQRPETAVRCHECGRQVPSPHCWECVLELEAKGEGDAPPTGSEEEPK